jgi:hypothetical protein
MAHAGNFVPCVIPPNGQLCDNQNFVVDIIIGTAQQRAADGSLLSTVTALVTDFPIWPVVADGLVNDPQPWADGVPTYIRAHIPDLLGNTDTGVFVNPQGQVTIDDADQRLLQMLETQSQPFAITGDTGLFNLGDLLGYSYFWSDPAGPNMTYVGGVAVAFYEHDIETTALVPEPGYLPLLAAALAVLERCRRLVENELAAMRSRNTTVGRS